MLDRMVIYQIVMLSRPETNENSFYHLKGIEVYIVLPSEMSNQPL